MSSCGQPEKKKVLGRDSDIYFSTFRGLGTLLAPSMRARKMNENETGCIEEVCI